jgi:hypothetical protein
MSDKPITVATATDNSKAAIEQHFDAVMDIEHTAQLDHVALAVIEKDADGKLKTDRHDTSAKHLAWGEEASLERRRPRSPRASGVAAICASLSAI